MTEKHKMQELQELASKLGPLCVGLDTDPSYIPEPILKNIGSKEEAVLTYNREIIHRICADKSACCCKVQIAYYEAMGLKGLEVYSKTLKMIKDAGLIAISDIKRGDIAATADAYAKAHFSGDFETDIITVNPYMGFDTLIPFAKYAEPTKGSKGMFALLRTSNPGMIDIEQQELKTGERVLDCVGKAILSLGKEYSSAYSEQTTLPFGAVVGCTEEKDARMLRNEYPEMFFLIPGYGAQGGAARIAATLLDKAGGTVNSSRGILCAWKKDEDLTSKRENQSLSLADIADSAAKAALESKKDLLNAKNSLN